MCSLREGTVARGATLLGPLSTGLFTIKYPVKEEAEGSRTRLKSSPERSTKLSLYSGRYALLATVAVSPTRVLD